MSDTESLWNDFHLQLHHFVARRVSNPADVDDIVQEVFLRVHQKIDSLQHAEKLHAWVYQIARNAISDHYRAPVRHRETFLPEAISAAAVDDEPPDDSALEEMAVCVRPILRQLSNGQREAIEMTELAGMTQVEAARHAGISHSGMKSRVQRARGQIRDALLHCCQVELDRRGGIISYEARDGQCTCCDDCTGATP